MMPKVKANEKKSSAKSKKAKSFLYSKFFFSANLKKAKKNNFFFPPVNHPNFATILAYNMKRVLKIYLLSYFEYFQIWLNLLLDDSHLSNIPKLEIFF